MNMHQVTPESIRNLREVLKQKEYLHICSTVDKASDSEVIEMACSLIKLQANMNNLLTNLVTAND